MTTMIATQTKTLAAQIFASLANVPSPIRILCAMEEYNKFRALDSAALNDMGLNTQHAARASFRDFLRTPQR